MKLNVLISLTTIALCVGQVRAEGGCPAGMIPAQGTNISSCMPISSSGEEAAPSLGPRWAPSWGATAQDPESGVMGAVADKPNKRSAKQGAVADCLSRGGVKCKVQGVYSNQCIVTVQGGGFENDVYAESIERATQQGMDACRKKGRSNCRVYYQACSLPIKIR
ncbi:DUF4189 domain-containing protein [Lysobacter sp. BMK333-48F3]|uniref:DUF4189 domain-containing protein n=1 Tax=Lysobacter sp. BMK333-48F3 TaxID=2867962 RepID=UPI001C8B43BB|nr:DUF4189 domain-containing protein [Lysobacter sp. BMK333-48F3]MBX9401729.1 DUF4189 domain-containing protein [Lysobacter sp. BMK333-48F3]